MKIDNHKLTDSDKVKYQETPNTSGVFAHNLPDTIVIHYTAGSSMESSANWLCNPAVKASAHLVVGKSGDIIQLAPFNMITWHAGASSWKGRERLNNYSIGIEIDNAGLLEKRGDGNYYTHFDKKVDPGKVVLAKHKFQSVENAWEAFTDDQVSIVEEICALLKNTYPINGIVGHDDIAPKRKVDPGPAFPMQNLISKTMGRKNDVEYELEKGVVTASLLNIRSSPDVHGSKVADPLSRGTKLDIIKSQGDWAYVKVNIEGWVSKKWIQEV